MTYEEKHTVLVAYLKMKVEAQDWLAVANAACDLQRMKETQAMSASEYICKTRAASDTQGMSLDEYIQRTRAVRGANQ